MRNNLCNTIAFYDIDPEKVDIRGWYEYVLAFFANHNQIPGRSSVHGAGIPVSGKTKTFKHCDKTLRAKEFKNITYIWFGAHNPDYYDDYCDAIFMAELDLDGRIKYMTLGFDDTKVSFDFTMVCELTRDLAEFIKPGYGIFFQRHFNKGPGMYIGGVVFDGSSSKNEESSRVEGNLIGEWMFSFMEPIKYYHGCFRDIYPINFISQAHLDQQVAAGKKLQDWILSSDKHGSLSQLNDHLWTWQVPKEQIDYVREELRPSGIIICI